MNTQGIIGKSGDTWGVVETSTKTSETDQGGSILTWEPEWINIYFLQHFERM
jgi:hypothetical protein